ncbi:hypothetical protein [Streptomyces sp. NPDC097640]|uniref:hypothetical protein n=1 Tax=Streptomyces sp. NPDC097640 TaxID=3157229 RepID=UPI00331E6AD8
MQLLRLGHAQHQRCEGEVLPGADYLKRQREVSVSLTAQTAPRDRTDLPFR